MLFQNLRLILPRWERIYFQLTKNSALFGSAVGWQASLHFEPSRASPLARSSLASPRLSFAEVLRTNRKQRTTLFCSSLLHFVQSTTNRTMLFATDSQASFFSLFAVVFHPVMSLVSYPMRRGVSNPPPNLPPKSLDKLEICIASKSVLTVRSRLLTCQDLVPRS